MKIIKFSFYILLFLLVFRCDGKMLRIAVRSGYASRKNRRKTRRQIRYVSYYYQTLKVLKVQQERTFKHCNYLEEVLNYIHAPVPNEVKGETLFVKSFAEKLLRSLPKQVVNFRRFTGKNLQQKILFSKVARSNQQQY